MGLETVEIARDQPSPENALTQKAETAAPSQRRFDIFLSHAGPDRVAAVELYDALIPHCNVFLDSKSLQPGDDWDRAIADAQEASKITLVLISKQATDSYYQREEVARAIDLARRATGHRVIPVLLDDSAMERAPYGLRLRQSISWHEAAGAKGVALEVLKVLGSGKGEDTANNGRA